MSSASALDTILFFKKLSFYFYPHSSLLPTEKRGLGITVVHAFSALNEYLLCVPGVVSVPRIQSKSCRAFVKHLLCASGIVLQPRDP